eukprot:1500345-Pyramimonas_sp.AAC.1
MVTLRDHAPTANAPSLFPVAYVGRVSDLAFSAQMEVAHQRNTTRKLVGRWPVHQPGSATCLQVFLQCSFDGQPPSVLKTPSPTPCLRKRQERDVVMGGDHDVYALLLRSMIITHVRGFV